jgi:hypothetical protein
MKPLANYREDAKCSEFFFVPNHSMLEELVSKISLHLNHAFVVNLVAQCVS